MELQNVQARKSGWCSECMHTCISLLGSFSNSSRSFKLCWLFSTKELYINLYKLHCKFFSSNRGHLQNKICAHILANKADAKRDR